MQAGEGIREPPASPKPHVTSRCRYLPKHPDKELRELELDVRVWKKPHGKKSVPENEREREREREKEEPPGTHCRKLFFLDGVPF